MPVFLVTNKITHARMVCVAPNELDARSLHPSCCSARRVDEGWVREVGGHFHRSESVPAPPGWPHALGFIHADLLAAHEDRMYAGVTSVIAFEPSTDLRQEGEGPVGWGGYSVEALDPGAIVDDR